MASTAATLSYHRGGTGEPLLLLHGIGGSWRHWRPVLPALEAERDVVAVDLPGFGASPVLARGAEPTPAALAEAVAGLLDALGWEAPHVAGNSLGGWVALELAKLGRARSVCALSPAGFATPREAAYAARVLALMHRVARLAGDRVDLLMRNPAMRALATGLIVARPGRMPADDGVAAARALADAPGWRATLDAVRRRRFTEPERVRGDITIAWAERDRLLLPRQHDRARRLLPRARHLTLAGCGHVPMWDDPGMVAAAILTSG
jgi:pimeloyl-ACP methyl ester carboxylesterase